MIRKEELEHKYARKRLVDLTVDDLPEIIEYIYHIMDEIETDMFTDELIAEKFGEETE